MVDALKMYDDLDIPPPIKKEGYLEKIADAEAWIAKNTVKQDENQKPELAISETRKDLETVEPDNKAFNGVVSLILIGFVGLIMLTSENNLILMCSGFIIMIIPAFAPVSNKKKSRTTDAVILFGLFFMVLLAILLIIFFTSFDVIMFSWG
tara:strand:+ start:64 stop:516 length:453 start_codon:yes stop_codon:yes gene_type:complete